MFYSHEILTSSQYGVATIWRAATMGTGTLAGKGVLRGLSRKAVQEVDVPKACEKILDPGAPLALRLQGSLLFGVSRVFSEQCRYVLSDASKTQSDMMTFFRVLQTSETDPKAGKTKRHLIMLQDDPSFDLFGALPSLDFFSTDQELAGVPSQGSTNKFSFMTPHGPLSQASLSSGQSQPFLFALPSSSLRAEEYRLPSDFGLRSSPLVKHGRGDPEEGMPEFQPFVDDELEPINGIGLDFDADGNLIGIIEPEPELPALPGTAAADRPRQPSTADGGRPVGPEEQPFPFGGDEAVLDLAEAALPDAEAFAGRPAADVAAKTSETTETEQASAQARRGRRRKVHQMLDQTDRISRQEFRDWADNYVQYMDERPCLPLRQ
ncbi:hypothetical protein CDD83_2182 [Cordyceps sp. RAO-2017]|nr:hypothetical protein CDD83_2182 [Cordyceps sp. RAO-2017]